MGTLERLTVEQATGATLIACEHRHRYRFAASLLRGLRVIDLCCGSGYGSLILADTAASVHGVDNDAATIDEAAGRVPHGVAVTFEVRDALELLSRNDLPEHFDALVCFEGLEHLDQLEPALDRLRELAERGMRMVLSVPNSKGLGERNDYHLTDFSLESAQDQLGTFPGTTMLTQYLAEGSLLTAPSDGETELAAHVVLENRDEPEYANHYVFCVGLDASLPDGVMQLESAPAGNRYMRSLERANAELRRVNQRFMRDRLGRSDSAAATVVARAARLAELEAQHAGLVTEHQAWIERCLGAEAREEHLRALLLASAARRTPVLSGLRAAMRRMLRRGA